MNNSIIEHVRARYPDFVPRNYPQFEKFITAYFEHLEQAGEVTRYLLDFLDNHDSANEQAFWDRILADLGWALGTDIKCDKRVFILMLRDYYNSRGSAASIEFLFRLMFGTDAKVTYPRDDLMQLDNARWEQLTVMFLEDRLGMSMFRRLGNDARTFALTARGLHSNAMAIVDNVVRANGCIRISISSTDTFTPGESIELVGETSRAILQNRPCLQLIPRNGQLAVGETITAHGGQFQSVRVAPGVIEGITIDQAGTGYAVGDAILATSSTGFYAEVKTVDANGEILTTEIKSTGIPIREIPSLVVLSENGAGAVVNANSISIGTVTQFRRNTPAIVDETFDKSRRQFSGIECDVELTATFDYPANWANNNYKLEYNARLLDSYYWQQYSYRVESSISRPEYQHIVHSEVHPPGYVLFSGLRMQHSNQLGLAPNISVNIV